MQTRRCQIPQTREDFEENDQGRSDSVGSDLEVCEVQGHGTKDRVMAFVKTAWDATEDDSPSNLTKSP